MKMLSRKIQISLKAAEDAQSALTAFGEIVGGFAAAEAERHIHAFVEMCRTEAARLERERDEERARFNEVSVIQARVSIGGKIMKVACAKPNDITDNPWLTEQSYRSLRRILGAAPGEPIRTEEDFDISVVQNSTRRIVETISK